MLENKEPLCLVFSFFLRFVFTTTHIPHPLENGLERSSGSLGFLFRAGAPNSYAHTSQISPGRKSLHEPLFVSDGFTIRCDPTLASHRARD